MLRKPFGQLKRFRREGHRRRAAAADRRADVGPLCDLAARHGRADAARPRRLHHRLARREAGAARRRQVRSRRLCRLSDRVPRAYRPRRAHARGLPALGAGLCRRGVDERGQASLPAEDADHDGRADRHPQGADRGQHGGDPAPLRLVQEQRHRHRALSLSGRRAEGLSGLPPARRLHGDELRQPPGQPLGDVPPPRRRATARAPTRPRISTTNIARSAT